MKCCGEERTSKFCPECGKLLAAPKPLDELLAHVRQRVKHLTEERFRFVTNGDNPTMKQDYWQGRAMNALGHLDRWSRWEQALVDAIARETTP